MRMSRYGLVLGGLNLVALTALAAVSAADASWGAGRGQVPAGALPVSRVAELAEAMPIGRIQSIEIEHGTYVVKAVDGQDRRVRLTLDPMTGAVLP